MTDLWTPPDNRWPWTRVGDCVLINADCLEVLPLMPAGSAARW